MQAGCPHCGHLQTVSKENLGDREKLEVSCPACGKSFQVENPQLGDLQAETTRKKLRPVTSEVTPDGRVLRLPDGKTISVKVLEGHEKGTVYPVLKPRLTLGRSNADIIVNDPLSSRLHCGLEISEEGVLLRDLGSTNGTLVDNRPIRTAALSDGSTFQIGKHSFQLLITSKGT